MIITRVIKEYSQTIATFYLRWAFALLFGAAVGLAVPPSGRIVLASECGSDWIIRRIKAQRDFKKNSFKFNWT